MGTMSISQATKAIGDQKCCKCGKQAKGLVCKGGQASYYCKRHLHAYMQQRDMERLKNG